MSRDTNDILDVLGGVTFSLLQETPDGATLNISIETDTSQIQIGAGDLRHQLQRLSRRGHCPAGRPTRTARRPRVRCYCSATETMREIMDQLQAALNSTVGGLTMADLGLSFSKSNELELDTSTLSDILSTNLSGVTTLLSARTTTSWSRAQRH